MPRHQPRPASASPPATDRRGIGAADVDRAADALLRAGERPTIEKIRARLGRGSPNTINPLLDAWWSRLAGRLDAGPAALHRLPEPVLLAAEGLWMQTLDEARKRAAAEQGSRKASLAKDRQDLEVRSHVLSIRESELASRLQASDRRISQLELELATLTTLLRKEQASRIAAERRLNELPLGVAPRRATHKQLAPPPTATAARRTRIEQLRIPTTKTPRTHVASAGTVPKRRKPKR
jgi:hypothetical protein